MVISLVIVVPGVALLLVVALAGLAGAYGRHSDELLVVPRNAGFGEASRLIRAEATRERARIDLKALAGRRTAPALVLLVDSTSKPADQRAA